MGNKGWHSRGYLPHYDGYGISQHVVFRLHDAVPLGEESGDHVLDRHLGSAILRDPRCASIVADALIHGDGDRYVLQAWCVMPNHVHVLLSTNETAELSDVVRTWKTFSAHKVNALLNRNGRLWAADYFDRFMRDEEHFQTTKRYIEANPVTAGLCSKPADWRFSSAGWNPD